MPRNTATYRQRQWQRSLLGAIQDLKYKLYRASLTAPPLDHSNIRDSEYIVHCILNWGFSFALKTVCLLVPERWFPSLRHIMWHQRGPQDPFSSTHSRWHWALADFDHPKVQISMKDCHRKYVGQNECLWIMYYILSYVQTIKAYTLDDITYKWQESLIGGLQLDLHLVHPPQQCSLLFPEYCCKGKVCGLAAGRTAWGKHSEMTPKRQVLDSGTH